MNNDQKPTITLAQWCAYLPHFIKVRHIDTGTEANLTIQNLEAILSSSFWANGLKPLLRPMNQANQAEINRIMLEKSQSFGFAYGYGFYCSDYEQDGHPTWYFGYEVMNYEVVQALLSAHYDIFNLIGQRLALPIE